MDPTQELKTHYHNGTDAPQIEGQYIKNAPQPKPTTQSVAVLSTGGGAVLSTTDNGIILNIQTRVSDIETVLRNLGLII